MGTTEKKLKLEKLQETYLKQKVAVPLSVFQQEKIQWLNKESKFVLVLMGMTGSILLGDIFGLFESTKIETSETILLWVIFAGIAIALLLSIVLKLTHRKRIKRAAEDLDCFRKTEKALHAMLKELFQLRIETILIEDYNSTADIASPSLDHKYIGYGYREQLPSMDIGSAELFANNDYKIYLRKASLIYYASGITTHTHLPCGWHIKLQVLKTRKYSISEETKYYPLIETD